MYIIVRENRPVVSARVGQLAPNSADKTKLNKQGFRSKSQVFNFLNPGETTTTFVTIESLIRSVNQARSPEQLPDIIRFNYDSLEQQTISVADLASAIRLSYNLASQRLNISTKPVTLGGICKRPVSYAFKQELEKNNFAGGIMGAISTSVTETAEMSRVWKKDNSFWDSRAVLPKIATARPFDLTFRQEQILQLIKTRALSNGQIANMLNISESTVKMHIGLILKKYGLKTRLQLVTFQQS